MALHKYHLPPTDGETFVSAYLHQADGARVGTITLITHLGNFDADFPLAKGEDVRAFLAAADPNYLVRKMRPNPPKDTLTSDVIPRLQGAVRAELEKSS